MENRQPEPFNPQMAMWLTLPGAAMCSIPIGILVVPELMAGTPRLMTSSDFSGAAAMALLLLIPITAITSREAYKHCISTTGHPGTRMVLMIFNFVARGLADLCIWLFVIGALIVIISAVVGAVDANSERR